MALKWVLLFALTLFVNTVTSQPCRRLFMQGLDNTQLLPFAELSGLYSLTNITNDGFSAYRHETHKNQFFFYNITLRTLVLGQGLLLAQTSGRRPATDVQYPYNQVITGWRVYLPATKSYKSLSADYIQPRCVDADPGFLRCDSGQLTFSTTLTYHTETGQSVNITQYEQVDGQYTYYRPIYKASVPGNSSAKVYLYHADGSWRLGNDYSGSSAFGMVSDRALRPEFITGEWQIHYNGVWRNLNGKLRCVGITTATSCSEVQCQNGGTCIAAGSQNIQCSCQRGYRGPYCERRIPACRHFGNSTAYYGGFYYTVDSYEGSLAAWFCARGSRPEFGYSVCENRYHRPSWSNHPRCQSLTVTNTTQQTWNRPTRYTYPRQDDETNFFEESDAWLTPAVAICAVLVQTFAPFVIYWVLISFCNYHKKTSKPFAEADEVEDKAIAAKYTTQMEEMENRTLNPENAVTVRELRRIQQQLDEEVDQLRARRRQRDREERKTVKLFRIVSFYYYVSFWLWMIYLFVHFGAQLGEYALVFGVLVIIAIICVIALPIVILIESWFSSERQYIKNLSHLTSATERIQSIRNNQPTVTMNAECYHYETRTRIVYYTDANGNSQSRMETYQEKVVTAFIVEPFLFTHWYDSSQSTLTDIHTSRITKIKMELIVQFGDEATAQDFSQKFSQFQHENRYRDVFVNFFVSNAVDGFEKRLAAYTDPHRKPWWVSSPWFWITTFYCVGWPYRILFNHITSRTEYSVIKVIFTNNPNPSTPALPDAPGHISEPPSEDDEENAINNIKTNIQGKIDQLNVGLSENDGDMPIKCAATNEHMNVTLQEAHHTPQIAN